jgi:hypothetical protein
MDLEYYLSETETSIIAIGRISKLLLNYFFSNCNNEIDSNTLKEMLALCKSLQMVSYCMLLEHENAYQTIDKNYSKNFSYEEFMNDGIII